MSRTNGLEATIIDALTSDRSFVRLFRRLSEADFSERYVSGDLPDLVLALGYLREGSSLYRAYKAEQPELAAKVQVANRDIYRRGQRGEPRKVIEEQMIRRDAKKARLDEVYALLRGAEQRIWATQHLQLTESIAREVDSYIREQLPDISPKEGLVRAQESGVELYDFLRRTTGIEYVPPTNRPWLPYVGATVGLAAVAGAVWLATKSAPEITEQQSTEDPAPIERSVEVIDYEALLDSVTEPIVLVSKLHYTPVPPLLVNRKADTQARYLEPSSDLPAGTIELTIDGNVSYYPLTTMPKAEFDGTPDLSFQHGKYHYFLDVAASTGDVQFLQKKLHIYGDIDPNLRDHFTYSLVIASSGPQSHFSFITSDSVLEGKHINVSRPNQPFTVQGMFFAKGKGDPIVRKLTPIIVR